MLAQIAKQRRRDMVPHLTRTIEELFSNHPESGYIVKYDPKGDITLIKPRQLVNDSNTSDFVTVRIEPSPVDNGVTIFRFNVLKKDDFSKLFKWLKIHGHRYLCIYSKNPLLKCGCSL